MADGQTAHFAWTLPENHVNTNLWGGQNNANWQDADTKVYANQQAVAAIQGQTSTATVSNLSVARTASVQGAITFTNSTAPAGQQARWQWVENTTAEAAGNVGSDFGLSAFSNTGAFLRTNIFVTRSTGAMSFTGAASFSSTLTCAAALSCKSTVNITAANTTDNAYVGFYNSVGTRQGYCGWINSGDQIVLSADAGASVVLTGGIALNGNVTGSGSITASGNVITGGGVTASGDIVANNITANTTMTCDSLLATQGAVVITAGSVNPNPSVTLKDSSGTSQANFYFNTPTGQTVMNHQVSGGALLVDGVPNFIFNGVGAYKAGGGPWAATSDARIKDVRGDYESGLNEVLQLHPVVFKYKGNDAPPNADSPHKHVAEIGKEFVGLVAQEVETIFPDMVNQRAGYIDGQAVTDLRDVDVSSLVFALVNCVKQLKAEIEALKAAK